MSVHQFADFEILLNLPINALSNACRRNRQAAEICQSDYFWVRRFTQDYPDIPFDRNNAKQEYIRHYTGYYKALDQLNDVLNNVPEQLLENVFNQHWDYRNPKQSIMSSVNDSRLSQYRMSWTDLVNSEAVKNNLSAVEALSRAREKYSRVFL